MFVVTVINFFLSSLYTGTQVALFVEFIRGALILDIDYPLSEIEELLKNASSSLNTVSTWSQNLPVSDNLPLLDSVSIHARWRYYSAILLSFGGLGPSSKISSR